MTLNPVRAVFAPLFALAGVALSASATAALPSSTSALTPLSWIVGHETRDDSGWVLPTFGELPLMRPFRQPAIERLYPDRSFRDGDYGLGAIRLTPALRWGAVNMTTPPDALPLVSEPSEYAPPGGFASLDGALELTPIANVLPGSVSGVDLLPTWALASAPAPESGLFGATRPAECPPWRRQTNVTFSRYGAESDRFPLVSCDGSIAADTIDRLSVLARPQDIERPALPLPLDADPDAALAGRGEWVRGVKIVHPRLIWVLSQIAEAFPGRPMYIISGYRQESPASFHAKGRALDLQVMGVSNEDLFHYCRKLRDVACGYYPNHAFVHVDVRPIGSGHPMWVDASRPGMPSEYVDAWPGVVEGGALAWAGQH